MRSEGFRKTFFEFGGFFTSKSLRLFRGFGLTTDLVACKRILKFAAAQAGYRQCNAPFCFESRWCGPGKEEDRPTNRFQIPDPFFELQGWLVAFTGRSGRWGPAALSDYSSHGVGRVSGSATGRGPAAHGWSSAVTVPSSTGPSDLPGSAAAMINLNLVVA